MYFKFFSGHFDTTIGTKDKPESYERILSELGKSGSQVLFLTDMIKGIFLSYIFTTFLRNYRKVFFLLFKEADAAEQVGIRVGLLRRPDNPDKELKHFEWATSFDEIEFNSS